MTHDPHHASALSAQSAVDPHQDEAERVADFTKGSVNVIRYVLSFLANQPSSQDC
jgi:hypothetical protein